MAPWRMWLAYGLTCLAVAGGGALIGAVAAPAWAPSLWFAGGVALVVQLAGFALLVMARARESGFLMAWGAGMGLRLMAFALVAYAVLGRGLYAPEPALLGFVGFLFTMVLLEPLFLRMSA